MRAVLNNDTRVRFQFDNADGAPTATTGDPSVSVTRADGTALSALTASAVEGYPGLYEVTLTAASYTDRYDELTLVWTATVDAQAREETMYVEVVGGRILSPSALRAASGLDAQRYDNDLLVWALDVVSDVFDEFCETAWVPRFHRFTTDGNDRTSLWLPRLPGYSLISATLDGTAMVTTDWVVTDDEIRTDGDIFTSETVKGHNVTVEYVYGAKQPPSSVVGAAVKYATHLVKSDLNTIPDRARMVQTEWGMFIMDTASEDKPTGLPEVDSVLVRMRRETPASFA